MFFELSLIDFGDYLIYFFPLWWRIEEEREKNFSGKIKLILWNWGQPGLKIGGKDFALTFIKEDIIGEKGRNFINDRSDRVLCNFSYESSLEVEKFGLLKLYKENLAMLVILEKGSLRIAQWKHE